MKLIVTTAVSNGRTAIAVGIAEAINNAEVCTAFVEHLVTKTKMPQRVVKYRKDGPSVFIIIDLTYSDFGEMYCFLCDEFLIFKKNFVEQKPTFTFGVVRSFYINEDLHNAVKFTIDTSHSVKAYFIDFVIKWAIDNKTHFTGAYCRDDGELEVKVVNYPPIVLVEHLFDDFWKQYNTF